MPTETTEAPANVTVHVNSRSGNAPLKYPSNYISTTNYTLLTFLPKNLFLQFHKASNCFFFLNMVVALIPGVSPVFPATTIMPLVVVLAVAAARDAYEDFGRYQSDRKANATPVKLIPEGGTTSVVEKVSKDVQVGDILYLENGAEIPADCVVISSDLKGGKCFVETANLDGETNLKPKGAKTLIHDRFNDVPGCIAKLSGTISCDPPSNSLTAWRGKVEIPGLSPQPLDMDNLLLRGCIVRNVKWVAACVVYTGVNTKLFLNLTKTPPKVSRLDTKLNRLIGLILGFQQVLIIMICALSAAFSVGDARDSHYLGPVLQQENGGMWFVLTYLTYFVLLAFMMPISLFVSLEFCKTAQAKFMEWDDGLANSDGRRMAARTSSLNEELSQVQYVFSDKTGTLTENRMLFAKAFAGGKSFDELTHPGGIAKYIASNPDQAKQAPPTAHNFLRLLAINNNVQIDVDKKTGRTTYDGASTDEVALVGNARDNGYRLFEASDNEMSLEIQRQPHTVKVLDRVPFTAERKMMSVIIEERSGEIRMYTKGADSSVMSRLNESASDPKLLKNAQAFLDACADEGLRTLACAERVFTRDEYAAWKKLWSAAQFDANPDEKMHAAALEAERNMTFVGCTAIEDRLQDEVPETIHFMLRCGIVVWVLTGDKRETAVNIAKTSRLLNPTTDHVMHIYATGVPIETQIDKCAREAREAKTRGQKSSFIVDGAALEKIIAENRTFVAFRELGLLVNSAVCCRVTPLQKATVVKMFQDLGNTCLGVGDGANDVSMIQMARVGIGIMGLEGSQAERASDYALPRFRHLRRLLAVHGRYALVRNSSLVQYSFYKNLVYSMVQVYYCFYNGYSGQTIFDSWVLIFFNMAFTFLPPMIMGMFDFDVRDKFLMQHPGLYNELRSPFAIRMSKVSSFIWLILALWHSWVIFYGTYLTNFTLPFRYDGKDPGLWFDGTTLCNTLLLVVNAQAALAFLSWTWLHVASIVLSFVAYYAFIFMYAAVPPTVSGIASYYGVPGAVLSDPSAWFSFVLWFFALAVPQVLVVAVRRRFFGIKMHDARVADYERKRRLPWMDADEPNEMATSNTNAGDKETPLIDQREANARRRDEDRRSMTQSDELTAMDRVL